MNIINNFICYCFGFIFGSFFDTKIIPFIEKKIDEIKSKRR